jgi:hypothetical protein
MDNQVTLLGRSLGFLRLCRMLTAAAHLLSTEITQITEVFLPLPWLTLIDGSAWGVTAPPWLTSGPYVDGPADRSTTR